jgi:hypothetical protein
MPAMRWSWIALVLAGCGGQSGNSGPPLTMDNLARACENAYACIAPPIDAPTLPGCLRNLDDVDSVVSIYRPDQVHCLAAAGTDCAAVTACIGAGFRSCSPDGQRCEGNEVIDCHGGRTLAVDCRGGLWFPDDSTCVQGTRPGCGVATCADGAPRTCHGTRLVRCVEGVSQEIDCAQAGATCVADGTSAGCGGTGAACAASRCDGNRLILCLSGHETIYDCAAMLRGGSCVPGGSTGFSCGFGPDCGGTATCAGGTAQLCVLGGQASVDCLASGFVSCAAGSCLPASLP